MNNIFGKEFLQELEAEVAASKKCIERVPESLYGWQPHEKSMKMGYLTQLVAEIPRWISTMIEEGDIDFATFKYEEMKTTADMVAHFEKNMEGARRALSAVSDEELAKPFSLKNAGQVLFTSSKKENVMSSINHLVHHRGQLTVYMRLNDIVVPAVYGPSADDKSF